MDAISSQKKHKQASLDAFLDRARASNRIEKDELNTLLDVDLEELARVVGKAIENKENIQDCSNALVLGVDVLGKQLDQVETQLQLLVETIQSDTGLVSKLSRFFENQDNYERVKRQDRLKKLVNCIQIQKPYRPLFLHDYSMGPGHLSQFSLNGAIKRLLEEIKEEKSPQITDPELLKTEIREWGEMKRTNTVGERCQQFLEELKEKGGRVDFPQGLTSVWEDLWEKLLLIMFLLNKGKVVIETDERTRTTTLRLTDIVSSP